MPVSAYKGRGAVSRLAGRFDRRPAELLDEFAAELPAPETEYRAMTAKSIISSNRSPDVPFDRSINPYQGCEHGCIYCYARPSHSYLDLSPGLDFETKIFYKPNAVERLLAAWAKRDYEVRPITIGANTDPYQPAEKRFGITRGLLEAFLAHRHPVSLITKGSLLRRDIDLLSALAEKNLCSVAVSIPTMDRDLKRLLEPRVPAAEVRLRLMDDLNKAGVPVSLLMAPVIPAVNDSEIESILANVAARGVSRAHYIFLRLPHEVGTLFQEWLNTHMPDRTAHVMSLVRQASGGKDYDARFAVRQSGQGPYAQMIAQRFAAACRKLAMSSSGNQQTLDCRQFQAPGPRQQDWLLEPGGGA
ncbi:MAG: PA0069 family radical SAM protein [Gammaproteobacteria bacterium]|nr:PA0069 family radical SAM protein [Gammaproteobacteria bacterium]MDH4313650.1 PA0069 family radical SAM protein [Gammaproteobacteria bacterium]MDH5213863.1 PA0069 family radical SAM protein [Gammaproteobacteria bacterium]MDH5500447.1 PA0069 family radical SAM protein [Gammaproteobacteria bacterium]